MPQGGILNFFKCIDITLIVNLVSLGVAVYLAFVATKALKTWKWQISHSKIFDEAILLEKALIKYLVLTSGEDDIQGKEELISICNQITESRFILQAREFEVVKLRCIEHCFRDCIKDTKRDGIVCKTKHESLLAAVNDFTKSINVKFIDKTA
jgi:hypothetical protein